MLSRKLMLSLVADFQQNKPLVLNPKFVHGLKSILLDSSLDKVFMMQFFLFSNRILDFFSFFLFWLEYKIKMHYTNLNCFISRNSLQRR